MSRSGGKIGRLAAAATDQRHAASRRSWQRRQMKMLAASSWWLPNSAIMPAPVRSHSRQRISSSMAGRVVDHLARAVLDLRCPRVAVAPRGIDDLVG